MDLNLVLAVPAKEWTQQCALCGAQITDGDGEIDVETQWQELDGSAWLFRRVWHKVCHLKHLDEGEKT